MSEELKCIGVWALVFLGVAVFWGLVVWGVVTVMS